MSKDDYLRERAESYVRRKSVKTEEELLALSPEEIALTLHELQVHQMELMMQNDELRRSHAELDAVKARYFELYDMAPVCYCTVSQAGIILQANLTTCTQLGMLRHSLLNLPLSSLIFREDQDVFYRLQKRLTVGSAPVSCELRMVKQDQSVFWVTLTVSAVLNKDGVSLLQVIFSDISERKQIEFELLAQKARLLATLDALPDLLFEADADGRIYNYHAHRADLLAVPAGMVLGKRFSDILPETAADACNQAIREAAIKQYSSGYEYVLPLPQGERWFDLSVAAMNSATTADQRFILLARDITERKRAEVDLHIAAIAFESQEGMMVTGPDAVILRVNQAFTFLTGYSAEEAIGRTPHLLCSGRHDPAFYQAMRTALISQGYWQGEIWNKRKNGEIYAEWLTITAVKGEVGEITHYIGTFSDITGNEAAAAEIHRQARYDPLTPLS
jgi:PAS domain S-box-containing protein